MQSSKGAAFPGFEALTFSVIRDGVVLTAEIEPGWVVDRSGNLRSDLEPGVQLLGFQPDGTDGVQRVQRVFPVTQHAFTTATSRRRFNDGRVEFHTELPNDYKAEQACALDYIGVHLRVPGISIPFSTDMNVQKLRDLFDRYQDGCDGIWCSKAREGIYFMKRELVNAGRFSVSVGKDKVAIQPSDDPSGLGFVPTLFPKLPN